MLMPQTIKMQSSTYNLQTKEHHKMQSQNMHEKETQRKHICNTHKMWHIQILIGFSIQLASLGPILQVCKMGPR